MSISLLECISRIGRVALTWLAPDDVDLRLQLLHKDQEIVRLWGGNFGKFSRYGSRGAHHKNPKSCKMPRPHNACPTDTAIKIPGNFSDYLSARSHKLQWKSTTPKRRRNNPLRQISNTTITKYPHGTTTNQTPWVTLTESERAPAYVESWRLLLWSTLLTKIVVLLQQGVPPQGYDPYEHLHANLPVSFRLH